MTKDQVCSTDSNKEIHYIGRHACTLTLGPRGGETYNITRCRFSGRSKTWKTRPAEFRRPVKHGIYESAYIDQANCGDFHFADECKPTVIDLRKQA